MPSIILFRIIRLKQVYFPNQNTFCSAEYCYYRVTQRNDEIDSRNNKHQKGIFSFLVGGAAVGWAGCSKRIGITWALETNQK